MADADLGPTSSYSDPFYDRLDALFVFIKRAWPLVLLVIVAVVVAILLLTWALQRHPQAGSATRFVAARAIPDEAKRQAAFSALADDQGIVPAFRAQAQIEVVQLLLAKGDTATAGPLAAKAVADATQGDDSEVQLMARLTRAAVHLQAKEYEPAASDYAEVKRAAGAKHQVAKLEATLGLARTLLHQAKVDDAIAELEPLINSNDEGANSLLGLARITYWDLKREQAEAKLPVQLPPPAAVAPIATTSATAVPVVAAPVVVPAPAAPAASAPVAAPAK